MATAVSSTPKSKPGQQQHPRRRPPPREVLIELQGVHDDPFFQYCSNQLRSFRNRYAPLVRISLAGHHSPLPPPPPPTVYLDSAGNPCTSVLKEEVSYPDAERCLLLAHALDHLVRRQPQSYFFAEETKAVTTTTTTEAAAEELRRSQLDEGARLPQSNNQVGASGGVTISTSAAVAEQHAESQTTDTGEGESSQQSHHSFYSPTSPTPILDQRAFSDLGMDWEDDVVESKGVVVVSHPKAAASSSLLPASPQRSSHINSTAGDASTCSSIHTSAVSAEAASTVKEKEAAAPSDLPTEKEDDNNTIQPNLHSLVAALVVEKQLLTCPLLHAYDEEAADLNTPSKCVGAKWIQHFFTNDFLALVVWKSLEQTLLASSSSSTSAGSHKDGVVGPPASPADPPPSPCGKWDDWPLRIVHHINEASRAASFLVVDRTTSSHVVIDPPLLRDDEGDAGTTDGSTSSRSNGRCTAVILSHVPLCHRSGVLSHYTEAKRASTPSQPTLLWGGKNPVRCELPEKIQEGEEEEEGPANASTTTGSNESASSSSLDDAFMDILLGGEKGTPTRRDNHRRLLALHRIGPQSDFICAIFAAPSTTAESVVTELWQCSTRMPLAVFTGVAMPLDALPHSSVYAIDVVDTPFAVAAEDEKENGTSSLGEGSNSEWSRAAFHTTRWFAHRYIALTSSTSALFAGAVFLPTYGGYNLITHQLDLHWAMLGSDFRKLSHVKAKFEAVLGTAAFAAAPKGLKTARGDVPKSPPALVNHNKKNKQRNNEVEEKTTAADVPVAELTTQQQALLNNKKGDEKGEERRPHGQEYTNFLDYTAKVPPLPVPSIFWGIRRRNLQDVREALRLLFSDSSLSEVNSNNNTACAEDDESSRAATAATFSPLSLPLWWGRVPEPPAVPTSPPVRWTLHDAIQDGMLLDIRPFGAYTRKHVRGSVNIPVTFPATAFGAKKAELWLLCLIPKLDQRMVILCSSQREDGHDPTRIHRRLEQLGLSCVTVMNEDAFPWKQCDVYEKVEKREKKKPVMIGKEEPPSSSSGRRPGGQPAESEDADDGTGGPSFVQPHWRRVGALQSSLGVLDDDPHTLVLDVRTHYEYRNGSHRSSVHYPLADLCTLVPSCSSWAELRRLLCREAAKFPAVTVPSPPEQLTKLVLYCAAGYRSHIAVSLIKALLDREARLTGNNTGNNNKDGGAGPLPEQALTAASSSVDVLDVEGGALRIMTYRPDLWTVKDRSIICIS